MLIHIMIIVFLTFAIYTLSFAVGHLLNLFDIFNPQSILPMKKRFTVPTAQKLHSTVNAHIMKKLMEGQKKSAVLLVFLNNSINALLFWTLPGVIFLAYIIIVYTGLAQGVVFRSVPKTKQSIILLVSEFGAYLIAASIGVEIGTALFLGYYINDLNRVITDFLYAFSIVAGLLAIQAAYEV